MILIKICLRVSELDKKIKENKNELMHLKFLIDNKVQAIGLKEKFQSLFQETSELMCEYEFYKSQFEDIEKYIDVKLY